MSVLALIKLILLIFVGVNYVAAASKNLKHLKKTKCAENVGIRVNGKNHEQKVLINGLDRPYQLSYYEVTATDYVVFFSYNIGNYSESTFAIGYSAKGNLLPVPITKVKNGFATAANHKERLVYLGGSDGVYVHDVKTRIGGNETLVSLLIPNHDIWDLFYRDEHLYFIAFPSRRLHKHYSGKTELQEHIHEKLYNFVIDDDGDTFINNKTGVYMIKKDSKHRIHMKGPKVFRAFEVDRRGIAHFCGQNGVYVADKDKQELNEIAKIDNIFGLTFDKDNNMIYSDPHQIVKLEAKDCEEV